MKEIVFYGRRAIPNVFQIGVERDNGVEQIHFVLPDIIPNQVATLYLQNGDYADALVLAHGIWEVTDSTTSHTGTFNCYVALTDGDKLLWNSESFTAMVYDLPNIEEQIEQQYPGAIEQAMAAAAQAVAANEEVQATKDEVLTARDDVQTARDEAIDAATQAVAANDAAQVAKTGAVAAKDEAVTAANEAKQMQEQITQIAFNITDDMYLVVDVGWEV